MCQKICGHNKFSLVRVGDWIRATNGRGFNNFRTRGVKSVSRLQDEKKTLSLDEEAGGSKDDPKETKKWTVPSGEMGNSLSSNLVRKNSEDKNLKNNADSRDGS